MTVPGVMPGTGGANQTATVTLDANVNPYGQSVNAATGQTNALADSLDRVEQRLSNISKNAGRKLINIAAGDVASITGWTAAAGLYERQLSTLNATAAITPLNMNAVKKSIDGAFTSMPTSRTQVVALAESLTNLGVTGSKDLGSLITTMLKLQAATGEPLDGLTQGLVQLSRLMGNTDASKVAGYANSLLTVSKNAGVSATGVLSFAQAIAPLARQAGIGEGAVLGISTAFSKAGADGFYAANTFNSIIGDITTLTKTGSPELVKYASFIGMTADQFKKLPAQQQITGIFNAIAQGGPNAVNFVNQLGLGTRAISSIQAVAQSGGLQQQINTALASQNGTGNLDKAAKAATGGLSDSFEEFRNQITKIISDLGEHFLPILTGTMHGLTEFAHIMTEVIHPFTPLIDVLTTVIGLFSALGGGALLAGGILAKVVAAGFIGRSTGIAAFRGGLRNARTGQENVWSQRANAAPGERGLNFMQRPLYAAGQFAGRGRLATDVEREAAAARGMGPQPGFVSRVAAYPIRGANWLVNQQRDYVRTAGMPAEQRPPGMIGAIGSYATRGRNWIMGGTTTAETRAAQSVVAAEQRLAAANEAAAKASTGNAEAQEKAAVGVADAAKALIGSLARLEAETLSSATKIAAAGARATLGGALGIGGGRVAATEATAAGGLMGGLRSAGSAVGNLAGRAAGAAFSPLGLLALTFGPMAISGISSLLKSKGPQVSDDESAYLNPVQKLNDQLGITTTKLASFASGLGSASSKLPNAPGNTMSMADALRVTPSDIAKYANRGNTKDRTLNVLAGNYDYDVATGYGNYSGQGAPSVKSRSVRNRLNTPENASALLSTYDLSDPRTVAATKDNLLSLGYSQGEVESILKDARSGNVDYSQLGGAARRVDVGAGASATLSSKPVTQSPRASRRIIDAALTSIGNQNTQDLTTHSAQYASARELRSLSELLSPELEGATGRQGSQATNPRIAAIARALATAGGGKASDYYTTTAGVYQLKTDRGGTEGIVDLLRQSRGGRQLLRSSGTDMLNVSDADLQRVISSTSAQTSSALPVSLTRSTLGAAVGRGRSFQDVAFGGDAANPAKTQQAVEDTVASATELTGSFGASASQLQKLADATGGAAGTVLTAASQWARQIQQFQTQTQSRVGQLRTSEQTMMRDRAVATAPGASQASVDQYKQDVADYQQQKEGYRQYLISMYQTAQQYGTQMQRAEEDNYIQRERAQRDFNIQMQQGAQDFAIQRARSIRDFNRQNKEQAAAAAQSIYNPYQRIQAQYTTDANTLETNLVQQNDTLQRQNQELKALENMGLSKDAIQTLNLASTDQAQQLDLLYEQARQDPSIIRKLNATTAKRISLTRSLTQNDFNLQFAQSTENFQQGLKDAASDYDRQRKRAVDAQARSLNDMSSDYNRMLKRSAQDLRTSMKEIYGDFGDIYSRTLREINGQIGKYVPDVANKLRTQIAAAEKIVASGAKAGMGQVASNVYQVVGQSQVGTVGRNSKGELGSYDAKGNWTPYRGYVNATEAGNLPRVYSPTTGHAMGGLSTRAHVANFSEGNRAEAIVPLQQAVGTSFMADFVQRVASAVADGRGRSFAGRATGMGGGTYVAQATLDQATHLHIDRLEVAANNADALIAELQAKARMEKLTRPTASTAGG